MRQSWTGNSAGLASTFASDEVDVPHQLFLVSPADGNFHLSHLHSVLEGVDVLDAAQIDNEVAADTHKLVCRKLLEKIFQRRFHVVFPVAHLQRAVLPFDFDVQNIIKRNLSQFVAHLGVDVLNARCRFSHTATNQIHNLRDREPMALLFFHSIAIGVPIAIGHSIAVRMPVPVAIAVGTSIAVAVGKNCLF